MKLPVSDNWYFVGRRRSMESNIAKPPLDDFTMMSTSKKWIIETLSTSFNDDNPRSPAQIPRH